MAKTSNHRNKYFKDESKVVAVRISSDIFYLLQEMADQSGANSISYIMRQILNEYFAGRVDKK